MTGNKERLNSLISDGEIAVAASSISFELMSSGPEAFVVSNFKSVQ